MGYSLMGRMCLVPDPWEVWLYGFQRLNRLSERLTCRTKPPIIGSVRFTPLKRPGITLYGVACLRCSHVDRSRLQQPH